MDFQRQASSLWSKAHMSGARVPLLIGLTALALVAVFFIGSTLLRVTSSDSFSVTSRDQTEAQTAHSEASDSGEAAEEESQVAHIFIHVAGAVGSPGVCELTQGARVQDAIEACGGFTDDAARDALNLARVLTDGEQVMVPTLEEQEAAKTTSAQEGQSVQRDATGLVNINTASAAELDTLPGVGPATAEKIIADREANGPFATIEDLKRVSGIGDKKYAELAGLICVG